MNLEVSFQVWRTFYKMNAAQKQYYEHMIKINRGFMIIENGHLVGVLTYFVGDDDQKYMYNRDHWTVIPDDPEGRTIYIDQLITDKKTFKNLRLIYSRFREVKRAWKKLFPNVEKVKWSRANILFRKFLIDGGQPHVYVENIT